MAKTKDKDTTGKEGFVSTLKQYIDKGVEASKKGFKTAGSAISDFGDKSVLQIELTQLNTKLTKEYAVLGEVSYSQLTGKTAKVDAKSEKVSASVEKIAALLKDIKKHEKQIKGIEKAAETKKNEKK